MISAHNTTLAPIGWLASALLKAGARIEYYCSGPGFGSARIVSHSKVWIPSDAKKANVYWRVAGDWRIPLRTLRP